MCCIEQPRESVEEGDFERVAGYEGFQERERGGGEECRNE
jgi:hypothetical protein